MMKGGDILWLQREKIPLKVVEEKDNIIFNYHSFTNDKQFKQLERCTTQKVKVVKG